MAQKHGLGTVHLVGAGPGDPGLLSLKAKYLIEKADVILYDYLVHPSVLSFAKNSAIQHCVGKRKDAHSTKQSQINQLMIDYAKNYKLVLRLKGGDPVIFGRLGEEMKALHDAKVPFTVVPGVSAAVGASIYTGIPLTHRECSHSVAFVTGTTQLGQALENKKWPQADTLVIFMALNQLDVLQAMLLEQAHFNVNTPVRLVMHATLAKQKTFSTKLGNLVKMQATHGFSSPSILIVGQVVDLADQLNWQHHLPLAGQAVWLFRPKQLVTELFSGLMALGADVMLQPLIKAEAIPIKPSFKTDLLAADALIFTSQQAVDYFFEALKSLGLDARCLHAKCIAAVGPKTSMALDKKGIMVDIIPSEFRALSIAERFAGFPTGYKILFPQAKGAKTDGIEKLQSSGKICLVHHLYQTKSVQLPKVHFLEIGEQDILVFTSSSMVDAFCEQFPNQGKKNPCVALGPVTKRRLEQKGFSQIKQSKQSSHEALIECIQQVRKR